ncbi:MAG: beta-lactamase family protein [Oscillospiraceae bacterium]|nr:beta-lactamase family protein [Oscillospiraceae bacterium]
MKKRLLAIILTAAVLFGCAVEAAPGGEPVVPEEVSSVPQSNPNIAPPPGRIEPGEPEPPPQPLYTEYIWQTGRPEDHGADSAKLESFRAAISGHDIFSALTVKNGVIIDEYYKDGYDENDVFRFASCTKSLTSIVIGIAIERGYLSGIDAKLAEFFPQLAGTDKENIAIEHLLGHTSGIYWRESNGPMFREFTSSENWLEFVFSQRVEAAPGALFQYTTGGSHVLAAILQEATGETAHDFAKQYLFYPLGMESVEWRTDPQGYTDGGNGVSMTARDAAKLGQLYLNGGAWEGEQIISREWVEESTRRRFTPAPGAGEYHYSWWMRELAGYYVYYALGHGGQYILVVPELDLVTVMTSRVGDLFLPQGIFRDYLLPAVGG